MTGIERIASLDTIGQDAWNALLPGGMPFYMSWPWLSFVEGDATAVASYVLATDGDEIRGACPVYRTDREENYYYQLKNILGGRYQNRRYVLAGSRRGYANDILVTSADTATLRNLIAGVEQDAAGTGHHGAAMLYLSPEAAEHLTLARSDARPMLLGADCYLPVPGDRFDDYLATHKPKRNRMILREIGTFARCGYRAGVEPLAECYEEAAPLVASVQERHGHEESVESCRRSLQAQAHHLGKHAIVFTARRAGRLAGFSLFYQWDDVLYGRLVGFDYRHLCDAFEYFNLSLYLPLRTAYELKIRKLHLGRMSYDAKIARGALPRPLWAVIFPAGSSGDWRESNTEALAGYRATPGLSGLDIPAAWRAGSGAPA